MPNSATGMIIEEQADLAARVIVRDWERWEADAGMAGQVEQNDAAREFTLASEVKAVVAAAIRRAIYEVKRAQ